MVVKVALNIVLLQGFPNVVKCSTVAEQYRKITQTARVDCKANPNGKWIQQVCPLLALDFKIIQFWTFETLIKAKSNSFQCG